MGQRRKKRYRSKPNPWPKIIMTGRAGLKYWEEYSLEKLEAGDLQFFMFTCTMGREEEEPGYDHIGGSGYIKARVYDGKEWQVLIMDDLFPDRVHHFSKKEMPLDTFILCREAVEKLAGTKLQREYRMHYGPVPYADQEDDDESEAE